MKRNDVTRAKTDIKRARALLKDYRRFARIIDVWLPAAESPLVNRIPNQGLLPSTHLNAVTGSNTEQWRHALDRVDEVICGLPDRSRAILAYSYCIHEELTMYEIAPLVNVSGAHKLDWHKSVALAQFGSRYFNEPYQSEG